MGQEESTTEDTEFTKNIKRQKAKGIRLKIEKQLVSLCFQCSQWLRKPML